MILFCCFLVEASWLRYPEGIYLQNLSSASRMRHHYNFSSASCNTSCISIGRATYIDIMVSQSENVLITKGIRDVFMNLLLIENKTDVREKYL